MERNLKHKSYLIFEQLGFGQFKGALEATKAKFTNKKTKKFPKQMQEIKFKITDKPVSLSEIYEQYKSNKENKSLKRLMTIIRGLGDQNIDIVIDSLGIARINYNAETSLGKRMKDEFRAGSNNLKKRYEVQMDESAKTPEQASRNVISQESEKTL